MNKTPKINVTEDKILFSSRYVEYTFFFLFQEENGILILFIGLTYGGGILWLQPKHVGVTNNYKNPTHVLNDNDKAIP